MEGSAIPNGWPLGLGNVNSRITVVGASLPTVAPQPVRRCSSFSSFSSSNLDTESTAASFCPDQSVPLGRLIGIGVIGGKNESHELSEVNDDGGALDSKGICTTLLCHVIARIFRTQ